MQTKKKHTLFAALSAAVLSAAALVCLCAYRARR